MAARPKPTTKASTAAKNKSSASAAKSSRGKGDGTKLVIVESPAKARTIAKFLGKQYKVEASIGHVRDLPENADEIPPAKRKEKWARLGVDVDDKFTPLYVIPAAKREQVRKLKKLLAGASELWLATDEDREGESISWLARWFVQ